MSGRRGFSKQLVTDRRHLAVQVRSESGQPQFSKRTDAYPYTNDQAVNIGTPRYWYFGQTANQVKNLVDSLQTRLTQIRVEDSSVPTFAVSMVHNSGAYGSAWWWYYGVDASTLGTLLPGKRLISLDPYQTSAGLRFAAIMVPNTGVQARAWWWYFGIDGTTVNQNLGQNKARLVSLRPYLSNGHVVYAVIMVANTEGDTKGWQWLSGQSIDTITSAVNTNQERVVSLAQNPISGWDAILIGSEGERWWWWVGADPTFVTNNLVNHNTRLIDLTSYVENGVRKYAVVELDDSNPEEAPINSESSRVQAYVETNGWQGGFHGVFATNNTAGSPIVAYNSNFRFEPASAIKALYLLYTLKQGVSLSDPITYFWPNSSTPNPNVCPLDFPTSAQTTTIRTALTGMIKNSNNVYTRAFEAKWGTGAVQAFAASLGMSSTFLGQAWIGCGFRGGVRNEVTLSDFAKLYQAVDSGTILSGSARQIFLDTLVGGPGAGGAAFNKVISEEASVLGKSSIASQFLSSVDVRWKAGGYSFGLSPSGTSKIDFSLAGLTYLPFKTSTGVIQEKSYYIGDFINDLVIHCPSTGPCPPSDQAGGLLLGGVAEALRGPISAALATWPTAITSEIEDTGCTWGTWFRRLGENWVLLMQEKWVN